ncbi:MULTISPECIES: carbohydrate ABC transporter permease [unclassified Cytobacillus]|uniref:carbohydrate ABC transporter permease n=1 Tax=unclassified Cytobacillus TaxID=2675268 RepID=UPI00135C494A|nr:sugar ABC transporter permease [Cytobacillus sp. AMY 15.2]KAF0817527.1 N-Acetyl-D-glucosamine ABC transport system, permease protein 1 [Bacillus sp. ZZV12-4809]MCM3089701.1 sugar ABC transporter permease [Cytobacillus sp. AMY 15.2]
MKLKGLTNRRKEALTAYGFLLPNLLGLTVFIFVPMVYAFYVSLHEWNALSPKVFIGFENYEKLASDKDWWKSVYRTLIFTIIYVPLLVGLSLFFAVMMNTIKRKYEGLARTMFLLPFAITSVISAVIWMFLYDPRSGFINQLLDLLGIPNQQFLGSTSQAMVSVIVVILWINLGYNMMIFLASIKEIPNDYYEAAQIDGATGWKAFKSITLPLLKPTTIFILIVTTIGSFQVFDQIMVMTKGGPANSTMVSVLYIYKQAFEFLNMGYASALAVVLFLIIFVLSLAQLRVYTDKD